MSKKACSKCEQTRLLSEFGTRGNVCKPCRNRRVRELRSVYAVQDPNYYKRKRAQESKHRADNPAYYERKNAALRECRANDPDYRIKETARQRARRADLIYREDQNTQRRRRRKEDSVHRKKLNTKNRRRQANPNYREWHKCQSAIRHAVEKVGLPTSALPEELKEAIILDYKCRRLLREQRKAAKA